jgi:armadillo repeat-containing protein 8
VVLKGSHFALACLPFDHNNPTMARIPPILSQIRNAQSHSEQASALRALKDEIIGHVQQKEKWVEFGVLEPIVKILEGARSTAKWNEKGAHHLASDAPSLAEDELARLQALQLLASFAKGECLFPVFPILSMRQRLMNSS